MAKGAVDLDDRVMVFSLFPTCAFLCVMVKINNSMVYYAIFSRIRPFFIFYGNMS